MTTHDRSALLCTLAAIGRLRLAYRGAASGPVSSDFGAAYWQLANAAHVPAPMLSWACGLVPR